MTWVKPKLCFIHYLAQMIFCSVTVDNTSATSIFKSEIYLFLHLRVESSLQDNGFIVPPNGWICDRILCVCSSSFWKKFEKRMILIGKIDQAVITIRPWQWASRGPEKGHEHKLPFAVVSAAGSRALPQQWHIKCPDNVAATLLNYAR